ncbi:hypothetical protein ACIA8K_29565 [Catenuloplanes sp. NPDC051500]|uniref:hypothetical protein n=1 Tax=Catenuloplanes sp. NPDC051500 TaxID=3363959 RepID=UPI0037988A81
MRKSDWEARMEPIDLAGVVVGALTALSTGVASGVAQRMVAGGDRLAEVVRRRFADDPGTLEMVDEVTTAPTEVAEERLTLRLVRQITADPAFAAALREALGESSPTIVQANESGAVAAGDVRISGRYAAGRDLHVGGPDAS